MPVTLSDDEVSNNESGSDEDGNFITFIATAVINESVAVEENPFDEELSEIADLQEAYNKLYKIATNDAKSVDLGFKKIASFELDKKNLLVKLFDVNELLNNVKTENILLLDKVKNLELELSVTREQINRSANSKLDHMLSVQKFPSNKTGLGFVESISMPKPHSTNFVSSSKPPVNKVGKQAEVTPLRKIIVDLQESKPNPPKDKVHDRHAWVCHFCRKSGRICLNCFKL